MHGRMMTGGRGVGGRAPRLPFCIVIAMIAAIFALAATSCKKPTGPAAASAPAPIPTVIVAAVVQKDVPTYGEAVGTTVGFVNADILPKVSGYLLKQDYQDGARVHAGQLLFEIDDRPYKAALNQALGDLAQAQAQLKQNQQDLARYTKLYQEAVIPAQKFDNTTQTTRASAGQVQADEAAVQNAKLNLQWCKVYSPIDGVAGIAQAQVGDLVGTSTILTTVSQLDPIKVTFPISEKQYLDLAGRINSHAPTPQFELILDNGQSYSYPGRFYAVNRQVDLQTGTIAIQVIFPNPEDILRPGMYAKVRAQTGIRHNALLVPQPAVFAIQGQYMVAVVGADNRVTLRAVTPGKKSGAFWVIDDGLNPRERVVADGVQKIREGMEVKPVIAAQPVAPVSDAETAGASPAREE
jgi:RND family efflux transporter MFP subunit